MQVDIYHTVLNLSDLVNQAVNGDEIILEDMGKPIAKIIPVSIPKNISFQFGLIPELTIKDDFDAPLPPDLSESFGIIES